VGRRRDKAGIWLVAVMKKVKREPLPGVTVQTTHPPSKLILLAFPATPAHVACTKVGGGNGFTGRNDYSLLSMRFKEVETGDNTRGVEWDSM
jgi:hypothetical protein